MCGYLAVPIVASTVDGPAAGVLDWFFDTVVLVLLCMVLPPSVYSSPINPILPLWTDNFGLTAEPVPVIALRRHHVAFGRVAGLKSL